MTSSSLADLDVSAIDPFEGSAWDREVEKHPLSGIFHETAWARVLQETYGHQPLYLKLSKGEETVALVPLMDLSGWPKGKRGVSLPFSDECVPLVFVEDEIKTVMSVLQDVSRKKQWAYVEARGDFSVVSTAKGEVTFYGHELLLAGPEEEQMSQLTDSAKRSLRKSRQADLTSRISRTWSDLQKFFELHELTRRRHGLPPQPLEFFRNIQRFIIEAGKGFVSLVEKGGVPAAGAVFFHTATKGIYKFGASDSRFFPDRPNHLAMWEGILELLAKRITVLDFGRTSPHQEGLRRFKKSWGSVEKSICYHRFFHETEQWQIKPASPPAQYSSGFRFMPLPINRLAGRLLYRHID